MRFKSSCGSCVKAEDMHLLNGSRLGESPKPLVATSCLPGGDCHSKGTSYTLSSRICSSFCLTFSRPNPRKERTTSPSEGPSISAKFLIPRCRISFPPRFRGSSLVNFRRSQCQNLLVAFSAHSANEPPWTKNTSSPSEGPRTSEIVRIHLVADFVRPTQGYFHSNVILSYIINFSTFFFWLAAITAGEEDQKSHLLKVLTIQSNVQDDPIADFVGPLL